MFKTHQIATIFPILVALVVAGCATTADVRVTSDLSTPKAAAVTFLRAVSAGDVHTAKDACVGSAQDKEWVDAMATFITGLRAFDRAITKRFGQEAIPMDVQLKQALQELADGPLQYVQQGNVHEGPESASVEPAADGVRLHGWPPIYLRKEKEIWKVDLAATAQADRRFSAETRQQYSTAGRALHRAADRVNAGHYKTLADAQRDPDGRVP